MPVHCLDDTLAAIGTPAPSGQRYGYQLEKDLERNSPNSLSGFVSCDTASTGETDAADPGAVGEVSLRRPQRNFLPGQIRFTARLRGSVSVVHF